MSARHTLPAAALLTIAWACGSDETHEHPYEASLHDSATGGAAYGTGSGDTNGYTSGGPSCDTINGSGGDCSSGESNGSYTSGNGSYTTGSYTGSGGSSGSYTGSGGSSGSYTSGSGGSGGSEPCIHEQCFTIEDNQDISFISVVAASCPGVEPTVELFYPDMTEVNVKPVRHGAGTPCAGLTIDSSAIKFEGLSEQHYILCITYDGLASGGDLEITSKAGQSCSQMFIDGDCEECSPKRWGPPNDG